MYTLQCRRSLHVVSANDRAAGAHAHSGSLLRGEADGDTVRRPHPGLVQGHLHREGERRTGDGGGALCQTHLHLSVSTNSNQDDPLQDGLVNDPSRGYMTPQ